MVALACVRSCVEFVGTLLDTHLIVPFTKTVVLARVAVNVISFINQWFGAHTGVHMCKLLI